MSNVFAKLKNMSEGVYDYNQVFDSLKSSLKTPYDSNFVNLNLLFMKTIQQPLKRTMALQPLSREHHDALLFVWKIRQGLEQSVSPARLADYCNWYWTTHLQQHMYHEEKTLTKVLPIENPLMNNMIDDHSAIRIKMEQVIDDPSWESVRRLAQIIYYHVRFEERSLFPAIEKIATLDQLSQISKALEHPESSSEWADTFWLKHPIGAQA
jgi:hypothetical protein